MNMKTLLIPVDGSEQGLQAVRAAVREGPGSVGRIELLNVQPLFHRHISRWVPLATRNGWRAERSAAALAPAAEIVRRAGIPCAAHAAAGNVATTIAEVARRVRADEIVMGAARRGAIGRLLANSVSTRLMQASNVPVRVIPDAPAPMLDRLALPAGLGLVALLILAGD